MHVREGLHPTASVKSTWCSNGEVSKRCETVDAVVGSLRLTVEGNGRCEGCEIGAESVVKAKKAGRFLFKRSSKGWARLPVMRYSIQYGTVSV